MDEKELEANSERALVVLTLSTAALIGYLILLI
jgi:hypothetical protein